NNVSQVSTWVLLTKLQRSVSLSIKLEVQKVAHIPSSIPFLCCADSRCCVCPDGWLWWMDHCYFFTIGLQENRRWNESAEFCQQHNSSLLHGSLKESNYSIYISVKTLCQQEPVEGCSDFSDTTMYKSEVIEYLSLFTVAVVLQIADGPCSLHRHQCYSCSLKDSYF
uniref:C-type lectin domain-containing protein n=1 Tax=Amphiprion ocellaris TaxID=80972 RepID=A0A3Q1C6J3_AMPOC